jgi:hypothetical protein
MIRWLGIEATLLQYIIPSATTALLFFWHFFIQTVQMNASSELETANLALRRESMVNDVVDEKHDSFSNSVPPSTTHTHVDDYGVEHETPTVEEMHSLRRVSGQIPWTAYTIAFVELCERFSYYGTTAVCKCTQCS